MRTVKVELGGQEFVVEELRSRANREWRGKLEGHFGDLAEVVEGEIASGEALAQVIRTVSGKVVGSVELITELLVEYAPQLEGAMDEAYDSEIVGVFGAVLGLAFPFGSLIGRLRGLGDQLGQT